MLLFAGACLLGAAAVAALVIANNAERPARVLPQEALALVPAPLPPDAGSAGGAGRAPETVLPVLEAGGWIQAFDQATGTLIQQYRFERLDPDPTGLPAGWVRMERPRAEFYLADHRVVALAGESADAYMPHRILESGTISGTAVIRMFEPPPGAILDEERDEPLLVIHTEQATFDNVLGEVRSPGRVRIESLSMELVGESLSILINDQGPVVRTTVEVERLDHMRMARGAAVERADPPPPPPAAPAAAPKPAPVRAASPAAPPDAGPAPPAPAPAAPPVYRLTLNEHVRVQEGIGARIATGDRLEVLFTPESRIGRSAEGALSAARRGPSPKGTVPLCSAGAFFFGIGPPPSIAPDIRADDIYVTCTGPLTMVPVTDPAEAAALAAPQDARMTLTGRPVELLDRAGEARVTCAQLAWFALEDRLELDGSPEFPLLVETPTARVEAAHLETAQPSAATPVRAATFRGGVSATDGRTTLWSDSLRAEFRPGAAEPAEFELERAVAEGDAQVMLPGGARAFGDRLVASGGGRHVELTGGDVALASQGMILEHGRRVLVDTEERSVRWEGPGTARLHDALPALDRPVRIARADLDAPPRATVTWEGSMSYDESTATARAVGGVVAVEDRGALERTTVSAREMTLHVAGAPAPPEGPDGDAPRSVERLEAAGDARLERRSWLAPDRGDEPRIFYLASERLEYDQPTGDARIPGPGELLIQDPRPAVGEKLFASRGTTSFSWTRSLALARRAGGTAECDIVMLGAIEMRHRGPDGGIATLGCGRIDALVELPRGAPGESATPGAEAAALRRLRAVEDVFLRTPERDVECAVLDYDAAARLVDLRAAPGGTVTVTTRATAQQVRFERATWDLATDTVRAASVSGGG
jgi:hypothetical protein